MAARRAAYRRPRCGGGAADAGESWRASPAHTAPWGEASSAKSEMIAAVKVPTESPPRHPRLAQQPAVDAVSPASPTRAARAE